MCEQCVDSTHHPAAGGGPRVDRRRFLQLAVASGAGLSVAASAESVAAVPSGKIAIPSITTRDEWGADESLRGPRVTGWAPFRKIVVHHTASPNRVRDAHETVRIGYRLHTVTRGFSDIGYHFLISPDGEIFEGRRARTYAPGEPHIGEDGAKNGVIGGHSKGKNSGTIGICLIGNFNEGKPTPAALESLLHLASWEAKRHRIDPLGRDTYVDLQGTEHVFYNIVGHKGIRQTECPGTYMARLMPWVRQEVAERAGRFDARRSDMRRLAWILD